MSRALLLTAALVVTSAWPAAAQNLKIEFHDGRVTVDAQAVPVRAILNEWGKAGGTKIVGADRLSGAPLTVKLINVTEAQALETILRSVAGYMAAPRSAGVTGPSSYDRILVMATSSAPPPPAAANARAPQQPNTAFNGTQRFVPPRRQEQPEQQEPDEVPEPDENPPSPPVFTFPQPGVNQPGQFQNAPGVNQQGQFQNAPNAGQAGAIAVNPPNSGTGSVTISPASPSAPVGVSKPGMMVNPPPPTPPTTTMIRPPTRPGGNQ